MPSLILRSVTEAVWAETLYCVLRGSSVEHLSSIHKALVSIPSVIRERKWLLSIQRVLDLIPRTEKQILAQDLTKCIE